MYVLLTLELDLVRELFNLENDPKNSNKKDFIIKRLGC